MKICIQILTLIFLQKIECYDIDEEERRITYVKAY